jgi:hypothetical protein
MLKQMPTIRRFEMRASANYLAWVSQIAAAPV